jgi:hypothetical protein
MTDLHLVASPSAAGSLRVAAQALGLPGKVFCIMDALNLGPLSHGRERIAFWRSLLASGYSDEPPPEAWEDAFALWRELRESVAAEKPRRVLIWVSESGADYVLLRMACHWLEVEDVALWRVPVPPNDGFHAVAVHPPEALAAFAPKAVAILRGEVTAMAEEYRCIAARPELLRECDAQGRLLFRTITAHDDFILSCCPYEWTPAARAVGEAMGRGDPRNSFGDMFVASRLQHLIAAGLVDVDGPRRTLRDYRVRRR